MVRVGNIFTAFEKVKRLILYGVNSRSFNDPVKNHRNLMIFSRPVASVVKGRIKGRIVAQLVLRGIQ